MTKKYFQEALTTLVAAIIIAGPLSYFSYRLWVWLWTDAAPSGSTVVFLDPYGPFSGWLDVWFWSSLLVYVGLLPRALLDVRRRRGRPAPGGVISFRGRDGDLKLLRTAETWLRQNAEALTAARRQAEEEEKDAARGTEPRRTVDELRQALHPPCPRCGTPVEDYKFKPNGWVLLKFSPCHCRMILNSRRKR
ncbi:hypothetical protein ABZ801_01130 [Actinomadura sp. NPDC047616]|uniref:hypothetical protein n=1 Tax=Actinomadura sp. NPDC047616 TaxID=3155914 RepID=UPI0033D3DED1